MSKPARVILFHLPAILCLLIMFVSGSDLAMFAPLKTESTFGLWVVVLLPAAAVLALTQIVMWIVWLLGRSHRADAAGETAAPPR